jgi:hypothetical protein
MTAVLLLPKQCDLTMGHGYKLLMGFEALVTGKLVGVHGSIRGEGEIGKPKVLTVDTPLHEVVPRNKLVTLRP